MNKKFSTLMASALLATSVGVTAQTVPAGTGDYAKLLTTTTTKINDVEKGYVQLTVGTGIVLAMQEDATAPETAYKLVAVKADAASTVEVRNTLWKVVAVPDNASGWSYRFRNLGTGEYLSYNVNEATAFKANKTLPTTLKATVMGSEVDSWTWLDSPKNSAGISTGKILGYAFNNADADSVMTLVGKAAVSGATATAGVDIVAVKYAVNNKPTSISNQITAIPYEPAAIQLGVDDLNSMLWRQDPKADDSKVEFTFTPNVINDETNMFGNLFTEHAYKAVPAVGFPAADGVGTNPFGWNTGNNATQVSDLAFRQFVHMPVVLPASCCSR